MTADPVVIVGAARTPMGGFQGELKDVPAPALGGAAIKAALARAALAPDQVEEVVMGCVLPAGMGQAPARQAGVRSRDPRLGRRHHDQQDVRLGHEGGDAGA